MHDVRLNFNAVLPAGAFTDVPSQVGWVTATLKRLLPNSQEPASGSGTTDAVAPVSSTGMTICCCSTD